MYPDDLVFGLLAVPDRCGANPLLAERLREFTISWSRYGYRGPILEEGSVNGLLDAALDLGYRWCLIQTWGHIIGEHWYPRHWNELTFEQAICACLKKGDFLVAGTLVGEAGDFGLSDQCLLINLTNYQALGRPAFHLSASAPVDCIEPAQVHDGDGDAGGLAALVPSSEKRRCMPTAPGWHFVQASLRRGLPVHDLGAAIDRARVNLADATAQQLERFGAYLRDGLAAYPHDLDPDGLSSGQRRFLDSVQDQVLHARHGVFLWNLESCADIRGASAVFEGPVSVLYSVAAGFKPNFTLKHFGMDEATRVVFFDYSGAALDMKRLLRAEWDGQDFPHFMRHLFSRRTVPDAYFQLWAGATPETVNWQDVERLWEAQLADWGGQQAFAEHWHLYRRLRHDYVECDILHDAEKLFRQMSADQSAVIWWSNAFFTVYGNWHNTLAARASAYRAWVQGLASRAPDLWLFGSDFNNTSVNHIQAGPYAEELGCRGVDFLRPLQAGKVNLRF